MKKSILILLILSALSCNSDDENITKNTEIETIINDVTSNNNILDGTNVSIKGFLKFKYSAIITHEECEYPCNNFTCNYETSNQYLVRDTYSCGSSSRYEISDTKDYYEKAIKLNFSGLDDIDLITTEPDCEGVLLENYPITISGELKYGTANNHELMLKQKSVSLILDKVTIELLNDVLTCTDQ